MNRRWLSIRTVIALLLVLSLSLVLLHSHPDGPGQQDCGLCYAQHMPGMQAATTNLLVSPALYERRGAAEEPSLESDEFFQAHRGRAPPRSLSASL